MLPILSDNARLLVGSFRSMSIANATSQTSAVQKGTVITLSSTKRENKFRISLKMDVNDIHDRYVTEIRGITNMFFDGKKLIIEADKTRCEFETVDELPTCHCKPPIMRPYPPYPLC